VQTAYANGASTAIAVETLGVDHVKCAKTGVKHCHAAAVSLDIGIYFEANGHGTVVFGQSLVGAAVAKSADPNSGAACQAAKDLLAFRRLINECVGDAISNLLAVEVVLKAFDWSCADWLAMYTDLPNRQVKVVVADRSAIETTNEERTCTKPEGLQEKIDRLVEATPRGRAFVRPSGTEDVVRVYAEAETEEAMLSLAQGVVDLVYENAGGKGAKPQVK